MSDNNPLDPAGSKGSNQPLPGDSAAGRTNSAAGGNAPPGAAARSTTGSSSQRQDESSQSQSQGEGQNERRERLREDINETADKLKTEARDTARSFTESARAGVEAQAERQRQAAAGELGGIARALRKTADEVQGQSSYLPLDRFARQAADKLDDLSNSLQGSDFRSAVRRLESYTRDQPGVVLGGAIIAGFLLARFMRASGEQQHQPGPDYDSEPSVH